MQNDRRTFIGNVLKTACTVALMPELLKADSTNTLATDYTVQDIINIILKEVPGAPVKETLDTLKSGSPEQKVTGIVTTMFATMAVICEAIKLKANFIIVHEPTFYNHTDNAAWAGTSEIVKMKQNVLREHQIAIWRFHDGWHSHKPDGILNGFLKKTGWLQYSKAGNIVLQIPSMPLSEIVRHLKSSLRIQKVKVIGDLTRHCKKIALLPGARGGEKQITTIENEKPDLLIVGEVHEWETAEYVREARAVGKNISLIVLGHSVSEEPGMEWLAEWLQKEKTRVRTTHIASGDPFKWI